MSILWSDKSECKYWDKKAPTKTICGGSECGDGRCDPGEECDSDCKKESSESICGDGKCDPGENCFDDCGTKEPSKGGQEKNNTSIASKCGNNICEPGEMGVCHDDCGEAPKDPFSGFIAWLFSLFGWN